MILKPKQFANWKDNSMTFAHILKIDKSPSKVYLDVEHQHNEQIIDQVNSIVSGGTMRGRDED